jgi:uncharacterized coiled-coil protein SlyX
MIEKIQEYAPDQFYNLLHKTMASVSFDPFSRIRAWAGLPQGISMAEIEIRIAIQHNVILQTNDFLPNQLSACEPRNADLKGFQEGLYSCDALNINAKDHLLRCLPRYPELVKRFPDLVIAPLKSSLKGDPFLIPQLIKDLNQAGVPLTDIYYLHVIGMSPGQYAHFTERESDLEQSFLTGLLMLSRLASGFEKSNIALKSILELVDPDLIDRYAKNDDQLRSAYAVTQDKKYLERMTDAAMDLQLSTDLGL